MQFSLPSTCGDTRSDTFRVFALGTQLKAEQDDGTTPPLLGKGKHAGRETIDL
jgi:hypothetical protein